MKGAGTVERQTQEIPGGVMRILVVDDHPIVREGLKRVLEAEKDLRVTAEASNAEHALRLLSSSQFDLALVDLALPGVDGFTLIQRMKQLCPHLPIVVVSILEQAHHAERALKAGASGFVTKADAADEVVLAVRRVARGELYVSEGLAMDIIEDLLTGKPPGGASVEGRLTDREFEVFRLLGRGKRTREVAEILELSVKTVETHQGNIKRKLGLRDSRELVYFARRWHELHEAPEVG